jgi:hypothetical protein
LNLLNNKIVNVIYMFKFYTNITSAQLGWITGKLPEIVSVGVLLNFFGVEFTRTQALQWSGLFVAIAYLVGMIWKKSGLYDAENYVNARMNAPQEEMLEAARKINKRYK